VNVDVLGFDDEQQYLDYFFNTLLKTNRTYDFYVDWKKVRRNLRKLVREISLLNALTKIRPEERRRELTEIFTHYPETIPVIPFIIAVREKSMLVLELGERIVYRSMTFTGQRSLIDAEWSTHVDDLVYFCEQVGVLTLFDEINDLYAYLLGVEVGLDTNARKNRSGTFFQDLVQILLKRKLSNLDVKLETEDSSITTTSRRKRADFVIYVDDRPRIAIECNFYYGTGSKPIETASSYIDLQNRIREREDFSFIWITDGPGWKQMKQTIVRSFHELDFPMNYTIASSTLSTVVRYLTRQS
jgi:type II restriction enzyme